MTTLISRNLIIYNLMDYMLNKVSGIKEANKETQERWTSEIQHHISSEHLVPFYNKLYPERTNDEGVDICIVWDDIIKVDKWTAIRILSDIDEIYTDLKEDFQEKALIYLMNSFVIDNSTELKVFPN